ncbi:MAG: hypothetical protein HC827_19610 [Cyanobacteria bacterium RM1_2_2]|nr:hypothetical protein [Cyanobacteria bacterium RM1_2_2]
MKPHLDQLIQCFERITQQLKTLEVMLSPVGKADFDWGATPGQETSAIDCGQSIDGEPVLNLTATLPQSPDATQNNLTQTCSPKCSSS